MPGIYLPTIITYPEGVVSVKSLDGTSYNQVVNSMGASVFLVDSVYIKSSNNQQITVPILYQKYDANGNIISFSKRGTVDPYQAQASLQIDMKKDKLIFDGTLSALIPILPLETCYLFFYIDEISKKDFLPGKDMFSDNDFFKNFKDSIDYEF